MMNSNMGMAIVCMVNSREFVDLNLTENHTKNRTIWMAEDDDLANTMIDRFTDGVEEDRAPRLNWSAEEQGYIFSAFNLGLLAMLGTGFLADKFNAKYVIIASVLIASFANFLIAAASPIRLMLFSWIIFELNF